MTGQQGGAGNDTLRGEAGTDSLDGGDSADLHWDELGIFWG